MESKNMQLDDLKEYLETFLKNRDELSQVEPLLKEVLEGQMVILDASNNQLTVPQLKEQLKDHAPWNIYLDDIALKQHFFTELDNITKTWTCYKQTDDYSIYTKLEEGSNLVSVFYKFKCPTNMMQPLSLMSEQDLVSKWNPNIIQMDIVSAISPNRKVVYNQRKLPFPLDNRDAYNCWSRSLVLDKKGVLFISRNLTEERSKHYGVVPKPSPKGIVRGEMIKGFNYLEPIDANNCWITGYLHFDPKLSKVPDVLLNFITKKGVVKLIKRMHDGELFENKYVKERFEERSEELEEIRKQLSQ